MNDKTARATNFNIVMTGLMICLIFLATSMFKIPIPATSGYVHLGDGMIFLAVLILGRNYGALAAGLGSCLGDVLGGYAMWVPWTFGIKLIMAFLMGIVIDMLLKDENRNLVKTRVIEIVAMICGGAEMCLGYFLAEKVIYGNWATAAMAVPPNIGQFVTGIIMAVIITEALCKTPAKKYFRTRL